MSVDMWCEIPEGEIACAEEIAMFDSVHIPPQTIKFHRVYVGEHVERLVFADGSTFERRANDAD